MRSQCTLLAAFGLICGLAGCGQDAAQKAEVPATKIDLGEEARPAEGLLPTEKPSTDTPALQQAADKAEKTATSADNLLNLAADSALAKSSGKRGQIDDSVNDIDEEE